MTYSVDNVYEGRMDDNNYSFTWSAGDPMNGATECSAADDSKGVVLDWTGVDKYYEYAVVAAGQDFTKWDRLSFRAAQGTQHPNTVAKIGDLTFSVTLRDSAGKTSSINIGAYGGGIEEPFQRSGGWHDELEGIKIRLTDFLNNGSGLDLKNIVAVLLNFGPSWGEPQGRLLLDEVELVKD